LKQTKYVNEKTCKLVKASISHESKVQLTLLITLINQHTRVQIDG